MAMVRVPAPALVGRGTRLCLTTAYFWHTVVTCWHAASHSYLPKGACRHFRAAAGVRALYTAGVGIILLLSPTCHNTFRSHEG
jgi:hypothetical protein